MAALRTEVSGRIGHIILDRPSALNALNSDMVAAIDRALIDWAEDDAIGAVVITSTSEKAFCAGGDVRQIRELQLAGGDENWALADSFFAAEYEMNARLSRFPKPYIAFIDGVVMGGGMGVSMHGSHRVVTEFAWCSMPEMAIGFVTDVGISYAAQRAVQAYGPRAGSASPALALFMGVTGYRFTAADMLWSGVATHFVPRAQLQAAIDAVLSSDGSAAGIDAALAQHTQPIEAAGSSYLAARSEDIEAIFGTGEWADIEQRLDSGEYDAEFVRMIDNLLHTANPASLVATTLMFRANEWAQDIEAALKNEYEVGRVLRRQLNFAEGVRAVLVDKDRRPSFDPHRTDEVDKAPFVAALASTAAQK